MYIHNVRISGCIQNIINPNVRIPQVKNREGNQKKIESRELNTTIVDFDIDPNPFKDQMTISIKNDLNYTKATVHILEMTGRKVYSSTHTKQQKIRLSNLNIPSGLYMIKLVIDNRIEKKNN